MATEEFLCTCQQCGNRTLLRILWQSDAGQYAHSATNTVLARCRSCDQLNLLSLFCVYDGFGNWKEVSDHRFWYPQIPQNSFQFLPPGVEKEYKSALSIMRHDANAFGVMVRRTLEAVSQERGAAEGTLAAALRHLAAEGAMPATLVEIADHLRLVGNMGAHRGERDVSDEDVPALLDFLELVLEYLYEAPGRLEALKQKALAPSHGTSDGDSTASD